MANQKSRQTKKATAPKETAPQETQASEATEGTGTPETEPTETKETQTETGTPDADTTSEQQSPEPTEATSSEANDAPQSEPEPAEEPAQPVSVDADAPGSRVALADALNRYAESMRPGLGVSEADGASEQRRLLTAMVNNVFGVNPDEFKGNMKVFLDFVKEMRKEVFHERYVFRFVASMNVPKERRELFEDLVTLTLATSDSGVSQAKKMVDVNKLVDRLVDERMIENLQSYYSLS